MWIGLGILLLMLLFLLGSMIGLVIRRRKKLKKREAAFGDADRAAAVRSIYRYILLMLKCQKIKANSISHQGYREGIAEKCSHELEEGFERVLALAQKAYFSTHKMSEGEWTEIYQYQEQMLKELLQDKKWYQKIRYKYWNCLY